MQISILLLKQIVQLFLMILMGYIMVNHPLCRVAKCILDKDFPPDFVYFCLLNGYHKKNN